jgi:hypothetical protein
VQDPISAASDDHHQVVGMTGAEIVQLAMAGLLVPVGVVLVVAGGVVSGAASLALAAWLCVRVYRSYQERDPGAF